jgi:uncharacterized membrane protein YedE/YeeE
MQEKRNVAWAYIIMGALLLISFIYWAKDPYYMYLVVYIWFGVAYGLMLQYGRFCFASASRDLFAAGVPRMAVGIMIALVFFSLVQATLESVNMSTFHPAPMGIHMLIAGIIFGVGMTLAGGCASGSLYKIGEGNGTSIMAVIFGLCLGQAIFVDTGGVFNKLLPQAWIDKAEQTQAAIYQHKGIEIPLNSWFDTYLVGYVWNKPQVTVAKLISGGHPTTMDYFIGNSLINSILPAIFLICIVYYFYTRKVYLKRKKKALKKAGQEPVTGFGDELTGIWAMITASKRTSLMGILVGITAGLHILAIAGMQKKFGVTNFGHLLTRMGYDKDVSLNGTVFDPGYWYITSQEGQMGAWFLEKFGWDMHDNMFFGFVNAIPEPHRNPALWMSLGIIAGAMIVARLTGEFKFKMPKGELWVWGILGGLLMGAGSRPSLGCNIGAFFIRASGGDPNGWIYGVGMAMGAFVGVTFFNWWTARAMARETADF